MVQIHRQPRSPRDKRPTDLPPSEAIDRLMDPWVQKMADLAVQASPEARAKALEGSGWTRVPDQLLLFMQSPRLSTLRSILTSHPWLYCHPIVVRQLRYLRRLTRDEQEWERLGWEEQWDRDYGFSLPPKEASEAEAALKQLVESHVRGLGVGNRIEWQSTRRKPGPKGTFKNPYPAGAPGDEWVSGTRSRARC